MAWYRSADPADQGHLYAGAWYGNNGPVYRTLEEFDCDAPNFEPVHHTYVNNWALEAFREKLYVGGGAAEGPQGAKLWSFDGSTWSDPPVKTWPTTVAGEGVSALAAQGDLCLYIGLGLPDGYTYAGDGGAEVWRYSFPTIPPGALPRFDRICAVDQFGGGVQCLLVVGTQAGCEGNSDPTDCDGNGMPDACELTPELDCDGDGIFDACLRVLYVDDSAPPGGHGRSWLTALQHLQDALTFVRTHACVGVYEIRVAQGLYNPDRDGAHPDGTRDRGASFALVDGIAIRGGFAGAYAGLPDPDDRKPAVYRAILSGDLNRDDTEPGGGIGDNSYHVCTANATVSASAVLDGFYLTRGNTDGGTGPTNRGGGLSSTGGSPTITGCFFVGNRATAAGGGGLCSWSSASSQLTMINCVFSGNTSTTVGGGAVSRPSSGAGYMSWDPWRCSGGRWCGAQTWGIGLDARKQTLLFNVTGEYELSEGEIDTTGLSPGHYTLKLVPGEVINVLRSDLNLDVPQDGNIAVPAAGVGPLDSIGFDIQ